MRKVITATETNMHCVLAGRACGVAMIADKDTPYVPMFTDLTLYQNVQDPDTFVHWLKQVDQDVEIASVSPFPTLSFVNALPPTDRNGSRTIAIHLSRLFTDLHGTAARLISLDEAKVVGMNDDCFGITIPGPNTVQSVVSMCDSGILMPYQGYLANLHNESVNMLKTVRERIGYSQPMERILRVLSYQPAIQAHRILSEMINAGDLSQPSIMLRMMEMLLDTGVLKNL